LTTLTAYDRSKAGRQIKGTRRRRRWGASNAVIFNHIVLRLLTTDIDIISVNLYRLKMTYLV